MLSELLQKSSLFKLLYRIDVDLADQVRKGGCPHCGGRLHQACYERKPRGGPPNIPAECLIRWSLCCGREECRRRSLPPSVLFMGRRVYWQCVILVVMTLRQGRDHGVSFARLERMFGICRQTLMRWIAYFRDIFPQSDLWRRIRGRVISTVDENELPASLVNHFLNYFTTADEAISDCLRFMATGQIIH